MTNAFSPIINDGFTILFGKGPFTGNPPKNKRGHSRYQTDRHPQWFKGKKTDQQQKQHRSAGFKSAQVANRLPWRFQLRQIVVGGNIFAEKRCSMTSVAATEAILTGAMTEAYSLKRS